jgi:hypothetical protein
MANKGFFQEKFQFTLPAVGEAGKPWATLKSAQVKRNYYVSNEMPTGQAICDPTEDFRDITFAGARSEDSCTTRESIVKGYVRGNILPTDDNYYNEHVQPFYGEVIGEDGPGFLERNNTLDRL